MAGLQGVGKTTACGKLANLLKKQNRKVLLVATDVYRYGSDQTTRFLLPAGLYPENFLIENVDVSSAILYHSCMNFCY